MENPSQTEEERGGQKKGYREPKKKRMVEKSVEHRRNEESRNSFKLWKGVERTY